MLRYNHRNVLDVDAGDGTACLSVTESISIISRSCVEDVTKTDREGVGVGGGVCERVSRKLL